MKIIIFLSFLFSSYWAVAFFDSSDLPRKIKNQCRVSIFNEKFPHLAKVETSVRIDLKNSKGDIEEKAWIYIDCTPKFLNGSYKLSKSRMECSGIRVMGIDDKELSLSKIFNISTQDMKVFSNSKKVEINWDNHSTFTIRDGKEFTWKLKSGLSGETHTGKTICK